MKMTTATVTTAYFFRETDRNACRALRVRVEVTSVYAGHLRGLPILWVKNFVIGAEEHIGLARLA